MFSGEQTLKADAILEYFAPLREWLTKQRKEHKYEIGWPSVKVCYSCDVEVNFSSIYNENLNFINSLCTHQNLYPYANNWKHGS